VRLAGVLSWLPCNQYGDGNYYLLIWKPLSRNICHPSLNSDTAESVHGKLFALTAPLFRIQQRHTRLYLVAKGETLVTPLQKFSLTGLAIKVRSLAQPLLVSINLTPGPLKLSDGGTLTVMPSMLDSRSPAVSDYRISTTNNPHIQSQITSEPLFPWQDHQQSALFGHAPYSSRFDAKYSTSHPQVSKEAYEDAAQGRWTPGRWGAWGDEVRQGPAMPFIPSPFPPNNSFQSNDDLEDSVSAASSTPRPTLPLPFRCNPRPRWAEPPMGNTLPLHDIRTAPQPQSPPLFSYDAADHTGPPFYSTASNLQAIYQPSMKRLYQDTEDDMTVVSYETDGESKQSEPPYAKLIYQALMAAPGYRMVLRDIYQWIGENTDKAKDPAFKGWQNSVRHNLSMNGVRMRATSSSSELR